MNSITFSNPTASDAFSTLSPIAATPQIMKNAEHLAFPIFNAKRFIAINFRK